MNRWFRVWGSLLMLFFKGYLISYVLFVFLGILGYVSVMVILVLVFRCGW